MTNKEDEEKPQCEPRVAALLAVHLVSQVLDEAYVIASAAKESGRPWRYVTSLKQLRSCRKSELYDEDMTFTVSNGDSHYFNDNNITTISDAVVTSTPQKVNPTKFKNESSFIGQGDEELEVVSEIIHNIGLHPIETSNSQLHKSTSMFINHLFDMSDVEHVNSYDESDVVLTNNSQFEESELLINAMRKIMESYVDTSLKIVFGQEIQRDDLRLNYSEMSEVTDNSSYSFLSDACDNYEDISVNIHSENVFKKTDNYDLPETSNESKQKLHDFAVYENAYMTLNRDYEQYSEEDEPVLQDPKKIIPMQEIELLTANTSTENVTPLQVKKEIGASGMSTSTAAVSRKSNLVRRCRIQGARLLSCLRGWWWRRKLPGKRKVFQDPRTPGSIRGFCPITPDARRRAASLLDQRNLLTPSPSKSLVWKFNTVNEALVHSSRWKEYSFKMSLNENDEF